MSVEKHTRVLMLARVDISRFNLIFMVSDAAEFKENR